MKFKIIFTALLLALAQSATADDRITSQAYEVVLGEFRAPATASGGASFKPCSTCDRQIVRVTPNTRYSVNSRVMSLEKFRQAILQASNRDEQSITVLHHLESDTIISVNAYIQD